jgi:hypothetical protein
VKEQCNDSDFDRLNLDDSYLFRWIVGLGAEEPRGACGEIGIGDRDSTTGFDDAIQDSSWGFEFCGLCVHALESVESFCRAILTKVSYSEVV